MSKTFIPSVLETDHPNLSIPGVTGLTGVGVRDLLDQATSAWERGDLTSARACLEIAAASQPQNLDDLLTLGYLELNLGEITAALKWFTQATDVDRHSAFARASRAMAWQLLGQATEAQTAAEEALRLDERENVALKVLARIHLDAGRLEIAHEFCGRILELHPTDSDARTLLDAVEARASAKIAHTKLASPGAQDSGRVLAEMQSRLGFRAIQRLGYHLQANDYYSPINDCDFLEKNPDLWRGVPDPAEIDWQVENQKKAASDFGRFADELRDVPERPSADGSVFGWHNHFWNNADAMAQYGLVRARKPRRYVEVGCGWSSLLLQRALDRNKREGALTEVTLVEPYPNQAIFARLPSEWARHHTILQRAPFAIFDQLRAGDVLFYDGSHCAKAASDVTWFFFRILPRLAPGVIIHLHDIHLPEDYSNDVIFDRGQTWNEQYVLQAFLMHNAAYRVLLANRYLFYRHPAVLAEMCRGVQPPYGCSFWMEKVGGNAGRLIA